MSGGENGRRGRLVVRNGPGSARHLARHIRRMAILLRAAREQAEQTPAGPGGGMRSQMELTGRELTGRELAGRDSAGHGQSRQAQIGPLPEAGPGWWVLAQGGPLDESSFEAREAAREDLLQRVRRAGVLVAENVWVWDLSGRAQLVLSTLPTLERARKVAARLREKGLAIVVRREMPEVVG